MNGSLVNVVCFEWSVMNGSVLNGNRVGHCLSKYKMTRYAGNLVGPWPPDYA